MSPDVALISPYPRGDGGPDGSGVARYTANLARALAHSGLDPVVLAPREDGTPDRATDEAGVEVRRCFDTGRRNGLSEALAAAEAVGAPVAHVQHEMFLYGGVGAVAGLFSGLARPRKTATVVTMHQVVDPSAVTGEFTQMHRVGVPPQVAKLGLRALQASLPRMADATIVHEEAFVRAVPRARLVPHGVSDLFGAEPDERAALRSALGLPEDKLVALCFGYLAPYKGLETALDAAVLARKDVELVVAGGEHPRLAAKGDQYAQRLRSSYDDIARFTGYVPDDEVATWFRACDVVLLPYPAPHATSGPLALALAHRRPVLFSPAMAAATGADRTLAATDGAIGLAERLQQLHRDESALQNVSTATAALARDRSWAAVAQAHQKIYEEVSHVASPAGWRLRAA